jgi:aryl-alcohol dehydrogenase-like predicted oxidoreductase
MIIMRITGPGVLGPPRDKREAIGLLRRLVDKGVTFIDTADSYGPGVSETLIAEALYPYPPGLVIASKGGLTRPGPGSWTVDCRPEHLRRVCADSLRRLRLDRIELYQLHSVDLPCPDRGFDRHPRRPSARGQDQPHRRIERLGRRAFAHER